MNFDIGQMLMSATDLETLNSYLARVVHICMPKEKFIAFRRAENSEHQ